jgi:endogenous inhibitor of DNA gyrase (YacG/DUF329 family)
MYNPKTGEVRCSICGTEIGNINGDGNFFALIRTKYCPTCKEPIRRDQNRLAQRAKRSRDKQVRKLKDEQLKLLTEENNLLREQIKELRRKTS